VDVTEAITMRLARELRGRGITVNAVDISTRRDPTLLGVAAVVAFLVSADGHSVNGQVTRAAGAGA
jgi:NAD(P)-dependent dehydrogenase (short-subunit alcohol dehydrogenase family)